MKNFKTCILSLLLVSSLILVLSVSVMAAQETAVPALELPVFTTSAGQSADINTIYRTAIIFINNHILGNIYKPSCQIPGIGCL